MTNYAHGHKESSTLPTTNSSAPLLEHLSVATTAPWASCSIGWTHHWTKACIEPYHHIHPLTLGIMIWILPLLMDNCIQLWVPTLWANALSWVLPPRTGLPLDEHDLLVHYLPTASPLLHPSSSYFYHIQPWITHDEDKLHLLLPYHDI